MDGLLKGMKVLVTGGSKGIGASCVNLLSRTGALVGFTYNRSEEQALQVVDEAYGEVYAFQADTSNEKAMREVMETFAVSGNVDGLQGLVVNAGIYERRKFSRIGMDEWRKTLATNLDGSYIAVREALPFMDRGSIVLISSQLAFKGSNYGADYTASKAGMLGLGRSLARELAPSIRVNMLSPGFVDTDILSGDTTKKRESRIEQVPLKRIGTPDEIARGVLFLLSELSSYMTGSNIDVNGGLYIH